MAYPDQLLESLRQAVTAAIVEQGEDPNEVGTVEISSPLFGTVTISL